MLKIMDVNTHISQNGVYELVFLSDYRPTIIIGIIQTQILTSLDTYDLSSVTLALCDHVKENCAKENLNPLKIKIKIYVN